MSPGERALAEAVATARAQATDADSPSDRLAAIATLVTLGQLAAVVLDKQISHAARIAHWKTGGREDEADLAQEARIMLARKPHRYATPAKMPYLARNLGLDVTRAAQDGRKVPRSHDGEFAREVPVDPAIAVTVADAANHPLASQVVQAALAELTPQQRKELGFPPVWLWPPREPKRHEPRTSTSQPPYGPAFQVPEITCPEWQNRDPRDWRHLRGYAEDAT
jgi:hypothetical protein